MNHFTKILATIGPATCQPETIRKLFDAGINAIRINMSHGDRSSQTEYIQRIRMLDDNFPIMIDTKGPEIRTGKMLNNAVEVGVGSTLRLIQSATQTESVTIPVDYPHLDEIPIGTRILFDDSLVESEVVGKKGCELFVQVINDGPKCPILASTKDPIVVQLLHLVWGVFPVLDKDATLDLNHSAMSCQLIEHYTQTGVLNRQDRIIIISGSNLKTKRGTNLLEVYSVKDIIEDRLKGKSDT